MSRQNQQIVSLTIEDPATKERRALGEWDKLEGGGVDSEESTYRAARGIRVSLGGSVNPDNVTLSRLYDVVRDHAQVGWLLALVGRGRATITKVPTNTAYQATGSALTYVGTLKRCTPPEVDSESDDPALIELEFTIESSPKLAA
jgi:hypothetical protein